MGNKVEVKRRISRNELVKIFEEIFNSLKKGELRFENLTVSLPEELEMELEDKEKKGRCKFEIELKWSPQVKEEPKLAVKVGNDVYIYSAICPHKGARLEFDEKRGVIVCKEHGAEFDPRTGMPIKGPVKESLKRIS